VKQSQRPACEARSDRGRPSTWREPCSRAPIARPFDGAYARKSTANSVNCHAVADRRGDLPTVDRPNKNPFIRHRSMRWMR
jgi:hypothetical protein